MPQKIRVKSETGGLTQPDQVMTGLQTTYGTLDKYKVHIVVTFVAVVVLMLVARWIVDMRQDAEKEVATAYFAALKTEEPEGEKGKRLEALQAFVQANPDSGAAVLASSVIGASFLEDGAADKATEQWGGLLQHPDATFLLLQAHENMGFAALATGDFAKAEGHFLQMRDLATSPYVKARALMHLGDMTHPALKELKGAKDAEKSRGYYDEAAKVLPDPEDPAAEMALRELGLLLKIRTNLLHLS